MQKTIKLLMYERIIQNTIQKLILSFKIIYDSRGKNNYKQGKKKLTLVKFITRSLYLECLKQFVKIK